MQFRAHGSRTTRYFDASNGVTLPVVPALPKPVPGQPPTPAAAVYAGVDLAAALLRPSLASPLIDVRYILRVEAVIPGATNAAVACDVWAEPAALFAMSAQAGGAGGAMAGAGLLMPAPAMGGAGAMPGASPYDLATAPLVQPVALTAPGYYYPDGAPPPPPVYSGVYPGSQDGAERGNNAGMPAGAAAGGIATSDDPSSPSAPAMAAYGEGYPATYAAGYGQPAAVQGRGL
jgi:hypothetical protein